MEKTAVHKECFLMKEYLLHLLSQQLTKEALSWLEDSVKNAEQGKEEISGQAFARIPSVTGKDKIHFTAKRLKQASEIRKGWNPSCWSVDQAARIFLLLSFPSESAKEYKSRLNDYFELADMNELETLCLGLPLYPFPEKHSDIAAQGLRSNMKFVFEAVALNNPFPAENFDIHTWNQMLLKALFVGSPVYKIYGVDERANANLASMLSDYAQERWAAGRSVSPELWRCAAPFMNDRILEDIQRIFNSEDEIQREAAALACFFAKHPGGNQLLDEHKELKNKVRNKEISWQQVGEKWYATKETINKS